MGLLDLLQPTGSQKEIIGISVTPGLGLEVIILDKDHKAVKNYGRRRIDYDLSRREIQDINQFKSSLEELLHQMQAIPQGKKPDAFLVLPNVFFDFGEVPAEYTPNEINTFILSEAEDFFIFKRDEPISGFYEVPGQTNDANKRFVYTSFQKVCVEQLKDAVSECGLNLIGIETAYSASLRGLYTAGFLDEVIMDDVPWTAMIINTTSFVMFKMEGKNILGHLEVPLAVKTYSIEEAYEAIITNASQILESYTSSKLFIISQVDEISANIIKRKMQFDKEIVAIESNKYTDENPLLPVQSALDYNDANSMTLSIIGAGCIDSDFSLKLNILETEADKTSSGPYFTHYIAGRKVDINATIVSAFCLFIFLSCIIIFGILYGVLTVTDGKFKSKVSEYQEQIKQVDAQIEQLSKDEGDKVEIDITTIIDEIAESNVSAVNFYDSIATDIPKNVWLTTYYNKDGTQIAIRGVAETIADVYEYYKNLRIVSPQSDIKLNELKVFTNDILNTPSEGSDDGPQINSKLANLLIEDSDRLYTFEISNTQIGSSESALGDETDLMRKPAAPEVAPQEGEVEEMSQQMKPAVKKRKRKRPTTAAN